MKTSIILNALALVLAAGWALAFRLAFDAWCVALVAFVVIYIFLLTVFSMCVATGRLK